MKTAIVIFNRIQFSYYHAGRAIDWAAKNGTELHGLFVHSDKEPREGYIFPSDIDPAERLFNKKDAEDTNVDVIHTQIKLFTDMAKEKKVPIQTKELINPSLKEMLALSRTAEIIFLDAFYKKSFLLANTSFSFRDFIEKSASPVELVGNKV
jgi:hypothetical protein